MAYFSWIDYTLFVLMFLLSAAVGVYHGFFVKQQKTTTAYFLGDKDMNYFPLGMSLVASVISSVSLVAFPSEVYVFGLIYTVGMFSQILVGFIVYYAFLPVFWKLEISTVYEYLEIRFDKTLRITASVLFTVTHFFHMSFVVYAPSLAFSQVTGFNVFAIAMIMCAICIFYTTMGGLKAVVWADTLQLVVMLLTLGCVLVIGIVSVGGFKIIFEKAQIGERLEFFNMDTDPTKRITFWSAAIGTLVTFTAYVGTSPSTVQRFLAVRSLKESRKVLLLFTIIYVVMIFTLCLTGIIIYARYYDCDPLSAGYIKRADQILPYYVLDVGAKIPGLSGLFIAGLFSASLSSLSTLLNTLSGIIYDLISPLVPSNVTDRYTSTIIKSITVLLGVLAYAFLFAIQRLGSILELLASFQAISLAPLLGMFLLGMLFPISNKKGVLYGVVISTVLLTFYTIRRQLYVWNGAIKYPKKPLYTYGCNATSANTSLIIRSPTASQPSEVFWPFRISFLYLVPVGCIMTIVVGLLISWFTFNNEDSVNLNALVPCVRTLERKFKKTTLNDKGRTEDTDSVCDTKVVNVVNGDSDDKFYIKYTPVGRNETQTQL